MAQVIHHHPVIPAKAGTKPPSALTHSNPRSTPMQTRIGLGDAVIAATAIVHNLALATHNTEDFRWITGLHLLDPVQNLP